MSTTPDSFTPTTNGDPRSWRDRPTYLALIAAVQSGEEPSTETLSELVTRTNPNDPEAFVKAVVAAAGEAVDLDEQGAKGPARELARQRAAEIDEKFETEDDRRDRAERAKSDRKAARSAGLDATALAAGVPAHHRIR